MQGFIKSKGVKYPCTILGESYQNKKYQVRMEADGKTFRKGAVIHVPQGCVEVEE